MKYKKYEYFIEYTMENLLKYNEEYFWKKGFDADVYLILSPSIIKKGGGESLLTGGDNVALSIPYRYFDDLIHYLSMKKEDESESKESESSKHSIFMDAIRKIQIWVNYWEDKWNKREKQKEPVELTEKEKSIFFDDIDRKEGEQIVSKTINNISESIFENNPYPDKTTKQIKIESESPIPEFEKEKEESEILEENVLENTREYKLLYR